MNIFRNTGCSSGFCPDSCGNSCQDCGNSCQNCGNSCCGMPGCPCTPVCPDTITIGTTITGAPGTEAQVTNSGTPQNPVLNFVIPQGATGPQGPQGPAGASGTAGSPGRSGRNGYDRPHGSHRTDRSSGPDWSHWLYRPHRSCRCRPGNCDFLHPRLPLIPVVPCCSTMVSGIRFFT